MTDRQTYLITETAVTPIQLDALAAGDVPRDVGFHRHAQLAWIDLPPPLIPYSPSGAPTQPQYRTSVDGGLEFRGKVINNSPITGKSLMFNFPLPTLDLTQISLFSPMEISWTTIQNSIPESIRIQLEVNIGAGVSSLALVPLPSNTTTDIGEITLEGLSFPMQTACLTKIWVCGDSFTVGAHTAIVSESGLSIIGRHFAIVGFGEKPPSVAGNVTNNVLTYLTQYLKQIQKMPGPIMVYMTIGTVDEGLGFPLPQIAGSIDTIVSSILELRPDTFIVHAGYNFESSFPSNFMPFMRSAQNYPTRYEFIDMYPFDAQISQVGGGDDHPNAAGHLERLEIIYDNLSIVTPQTIANSCP